jgi:hypothetical protein
MAEGGTIGRANIELGVDASKLDTGMSAAKAKVEADVAEMDAIANVSLTAGGDEDAYEGALAAQEELRYREALAGLAERTQSETTTFLLEEQRYQETLRRINADVIAADAEKARYAEALFEMRKRQLQVENETVGVARRQEASDAAAQAALDEELAKKQAIAAAEQAALDAEIAKKQQLAAAEVEADIRHQEALKSIHATTKNVVDEMPNMKPPPVKKQTWLESLLDDSKSLNKSMVAFGKLAIVATVAASMYKLGQAIRENVIKALESGTDAANKFRDSLNTTDIGQRLSSTQQEVDKLNEKIAAQSGSWFASALGFIQGEGTAKLEEQRNELNADVGRMQRDRAAQEKAAKDRKRTSTFNEIAYDREEQRIEQLTDERMKANARFALENRKIDDEIAAEQDTKMKEVLRQKKINIAEQYQFEMEEARKAEEKKLQDAQEQLDKEEADRKEKAKDNRELEYQLMDDRQEHAARFLDEYNDLEEQFRNAKDVRDKQLIREQMQLRAKLFNKEVAEQQKELMKAQQEQFKSLRNDIAGLFNSQQLEVGINKLGSLLGVLIQKTGDNR